MGLRILKEGRKFSLTFQSTEEYLGVLTILVYLLTILGHSLLPRRIFKGQESYFWLLQLSGLASDNIRAAREKDLLPLPG